MLFEESSYTCHIATRILSSGSEGIELESALFYAAGGGQPGDSGFLRLSDGRSIRIVDTKRRESDRRIVLLQPEAETDLKPGEVVEAELDWDRRYRHMRMHTALHLLASVVTAPITGCGIAADKGRLDFDIPELMFDKDWLTGRLRELIATAVPVAARYANLDEIGELQNVVRTRFVLPPTQDDRVRLIEIQGLDIQACGGTHVSNTDEVGKVACTRIEKKSRHNRRIVIQFED